MPPSEAGSRTSQSPNRAVLLSFAGALLAVIVFGPPASRAEGTANLQVDFRYAPRWWQTPICLPDDPEKTLVGKDGEILCQYPVKVGAKPLDDYPPPFPGFQGALPSV